MTDSLVQASASVRVCAEYVNGPGAVCTILVGLQGRWHLMVHTVMSRAIEICNMHSG